MERAPTVAALAAPAEPPAGVLHPAHRGLLGLPPIIASGAWYMASSAAETRELANNVALFERQTGMEHAGQNTQIARNAETLQSMDQRVTRIEAQLASTPASTARAMTPASPKAKQGKPPSCSAPKQDPSRVALAKQDGSGVKASTKERTQLAIAAINIRLRSLRASSYDRACLCADRDGLKGYLAFLEIMTEVAAAIRSGRVPPG
jgi:hypothetical protein